MTKMIRGETTHEDGIVELTFGEWIALVKMIDAPPRPPAFLLHALRPETRARFFANCETNDPIYPELG